MTKIGTETRGGGSLSTRSHTPLSQGARAERQKMLGPLTYTQKSEFSTVTDVQKDLFLQGSGTLPITGALASQNFWDLVHARTHYEK